MNNSKIAIISTVINFDLYTKSSQLFPENIDRYVIDGRNGMHGIDSIFYMIKKLKNKNIDWLIMADEDVLFQDSSVIFDIINKMKSDNYSVCGVRDGGVISHRIYNPYLINTFFSIINFKEIKEIWNKSKVIENNYILDNEFNDDLKNIKGNYDKKSIYEAYYCFYLWLRRKNKKFLFLDAKMNDDQITNSVLYNNKVFLYHTWYARSYGNNEKHTNRIDTLLKLMKFENNRIYQYVIFKDQKYFVTQKIKKMYRRFMKRLNNWS